MTPQPVVVADAVHQQPLTRTSPSTALSALSVAKTGDETKATDSGVDIAGAVKQAKMGQIEFRADKTAIVHAPVGKVCVRA